MGSIPQHLHLLHPALLKVSLLPWPRGAFGPVTAHRLLRLIAGYQLVVAIGVGLLHAPMGDGWHIFGLGQGCLDAHR